MKRHLVFLMISSSLFLTSCFKENMGAAGATGPAGPAYTGVINGHVFLYDEYGTRIDTGLSGIQVTINNSSKDTMVMTDANGAYAFSNIVTGNYSITAHVPNNQYGDVKVPNFQYINDTLNRDVKMSVIAAFSPLSLTAMLAASGNDSVTLTFASDSKQRSYIVFVNSSSSVNGTPANYLSYYVKNIPANQTKATLLVPASDLRDIGINSGAIVYFAAYGYPVSDYSAYEDITTSKMIFNALSTAPLYANAVAP